MFVPRSPRFRLRWLRPTGPPFPSWLSDEAWVPPGNREVYSAARSGLAVVCERVHPDVVLLPVFLPLDVVRVFRRAGADVQFYPPNRDLSLPVGEVCARLRTTDSAVVVFAHYFGFADANFQALVSAARKAGAFVVEDVARGLFARDEDGRLLGSTGDASVFSLHKVLPVPHGGLVTARTIELPTPDTSVTDHRSLAVSAGVAGARLVDWFPLALADGLPEVRSIDRPRNGSAGGCTPIVAPGQVSRLGLSRCDPAEIQAGRLARYTELRKRLLGVDGLEVLTPPPYEGACPYGIAVHVREGRAACDDVFRALRSRSLPADVFRWPMPVGPAGEDELPDAVALRESTLVVPTHQQLPAAAIEPIVHTIKRHL